MATEEDLSIAKLGKCSGKLLLFAEVKQLLSAVQLVVDTKKICRHRAKDINITFSSTEIVVQVDRTTITFRLDKLRLTPASCNGLICLPNGEIQLRMQVSGPSVGCQMNTSQKFRHQRELVEKISKYYRNCTCALCGQKLLCNDCKFTRVLPLPSENWSEMSDSWFCHRHDDNNSAQIPNTLLPRQSDCLVGELYFLVHKSKMLERSYMINKKGFIQCQRCHNTLGELHKGRPLCLDKTGQAGEKVVYPETFKIHFHNLSLGPDEHTNQNNKHQKEVPLSKSQRLLVKEEDFIARYFLEQSRVFTSYRFMVQPQVKRQKHCRLCCLVWLLDGDAQMYNKEVNLRSEVVSKVMSESKHTSRVTEVKQTTAVKVLYRAYFNHLDSISVADPSNIKLQSQWKTDKSVHGIELPYSLYISFIATLLRNTRQLPSSLRYLNGFHVGFLHKSSTSIT